MEEIEEDESFITQSKASMWYRVNKPDMVTHAARKQFGWVSDVFADCTLVIDSESNDIGRVASEVRDEFCNLIARSAYVGQNMIAYITFTCTYAKHDIKHNTVEFIKGVEIDSPTVNFFYVRLSDCEEFYDSVMSKMHEDMFFNRLAGSNMLLVSIDKFKYTGTMYYPDAGAAAEYTAEFAEADEFGRGPYMKTFKRKHRDAVKKKFLEGFNKKAREDTTL